MNHNHKHNHCSHAQVKFCSHCNTVYCEHCNQEWSPKFTWTYNQASLGQYINNNDLYKAIPTTVTCHAHEEA